MALADAAVTSPGKAARGDRDGVYQNSLRGESKSER